MTQVSGDMTSGEMALGDLTVNPIYIDTLVSSQG